MSTILNIRNLKLPAVSRTALVVGTVVVLAIVGGLIGWNVYKKLTTNTVVAYFPDTSALPLTPWGALVQARPTLLTSWSVSAC
jgi:phospholipid/cholesterol/gamma-HCH transport system substrate-binding protein